MNTLPGQHSKSNRILAYARPKPFLNKYTFKSNARTGLHCSSTNMLTKMPWTSRHVWIAALDTLRKLTLRKMTPKKKTLKKRAPALYRWKTKISDGVLQYHSWSVHQIPFNRIHSSLNSPKAGVEIPVSRRCVEQRMVSSNMKFVIFGVEKGVNTRRDTLNMKLSNL